LQLVDTSGRQKIGAPLEKAAIQICLSDIPNSLVRARLEPVLLFEIILLPHIDYVTSSIRVIFDIVNQVLRQIPLFNRSAVALTNSSVSDIPFIPPRNVVFITKQIKVIGHIPVYPQKLPDG
jgi:hypothetical protein